MINPTAPVSEITMSGIEESMDFMLDASATAHILNMLRSGVYKDPKAACVREYWCNARDSVIEAGKDPSQHVFITLPNMYEPYFKVRDEGMGLSESEFRRIFRKYGASTKRDSNEQIGCLGIGSKSAFSYSDTFTVTSVKNGVKRVFIASVARNSVAKDGVGNLNKVEEIDTDLPNGVEVSIPVKDCDFYDFKQKVCNFLSFIPVDQRPIVRGINQSLIEIPEREAKYSGPNWKLTGTYNSYAIMGGVPYNLDTRSMDMLTADERGLIEIGVDIIFPIGAFEFAISREEMRYTELSQLAVKVELQKILASVAAEFTTRFANAKNIWEAKYLYYSLKQNDIDSAIVEKCFQDAAGPSIKWAGKDITNSTIQIKRGEFHDCTSDSFGGVDRTKTKTISVKNDFCPFFIIHDTSKYGEKQRISTALKKIDGLGFDGCIVIKFDDDAAKTEFFTEYNFDQMPTTLLSSYERDRSMSTAARQRSRTFVFDYVKSSSKEDSWDAETPELDKGGYYVELSSKFRQLPYGFYQPINNYQLNEVMKGLKAIGEPLSVLWGFKAAVIANLDKTKWFPFYPYAKERLALYLRSLNVYQNDFDANAFNSAHDEYDLSFNCYNEKNIRTNLIPLITKADSLFLKYWEVKKVLAETFGVEDEQYEALTNAYTSVGGIVHELRPANQTLSPSVVDFRSLTAEVAAKYPMLKTISGFSSENYAKIIADYINEKDA